MVALAKQTITETTPRIIVFSDLRPSQTNAFDIVVSQLDIEDKVAITNRATSAIPEFENDREFWQNMSTKKDTPVLVFVDEDAVENTGGNIAHWNENYRKLLETMYKFTKQFAIVKINPSRDSRGAHELGNQLLSKTEKENPSEAAIERLRKYSRASNNTLLLGLDKKGSIDRICDFLYVFTKALGLLKK